MDTGRMYRANMPVLLLSCLLSVGVHCAFTVQVYLIARGLPGNFLSLAEHFAVYPIAGIASSVPLPAGPFEGCLDFLYCHVREPVFLVAGQGLVVALVYRLITVLIAAVGFCYYLGGRREVAEVMSEVEGDSRD
jgi:hypothetical protein